MERVMGRRDRIWRSQKTEPQNVKEELLKHTLPRDRHPVSHISPSSPRSRNKEAGNQVGLM
ncbi:hypothetical protein P7K49_006169, partial [Saguinus oedipus]